MGAIRDFQKRLARVPISKIERGVLQILKRHENILIDANTNQLMRGEDSEGNVIDPPYASRHYAEFKLMLNPAGVVDLYLTGNFHSRWRFVATRWPAYFVSTDKKAKELIGKYGKDVYGVQKETFGEINQSDIKPDVQDFFRRDVFELR